MEAPTSLDVTGKNLVEIKIETSRNPSPGPVPAAQNSPGNREPPERPARVGNKQHHQAGGVSAREVPKIVTTPNTAAVSPVAQQQQYSGHHPFHGAHLPLSATASLSNTSGNVNSSYVGDRTNVDRNRSRSNEPSCRPTPAKRNPNKMNAKEVTDVQQMEQGLVQLLDDFHSGKLQAFGKDCSFEKMDNVRERQERLARLHFDLGSQQESYGTLSEEGRTIAKDHLAKLMVQLQELSLSIEQLQSSTSGTNLQTEV